MSWTDLAVASVAVACFHLLGWCLRLSRRLAGIEHHSKLDPLTGLGTGQWLETRWRVALRSGCPLGVVYLDLDRLKLRNDRWGHAAGDDYIKTAGEAIERACRRGVDEVFRAYNKGDEFVILLHGPLTDLRGFSWSLLRRLRARGVTASIGLAYTQETGYLPARVELRTAAEAGCRRAKQAGGDCALVIDHPPVGRAASELLRGSEPEAAQAGPGAASEELAPFACVPVPIIEDIQTERIGQQ